MPAASVVLADRVQETSFSTGTGTINLAGALSGYRTFDSAIGIGNNTYYCITNAAAGQWEVGVGTVGSATLARIAVYSSSNSNALVNFSSGGLLVFCTYPASTAIYTDSASGAPTPFGIFTSVGSGTINGYIEVKDVTGTVRKLAVIA